MAEPKKRTLRGVYDGLKQISDEEGIDFGIDNYTYEQFAHKYGDKNSLAALHKLLSTISDEESVDFGIGSADEWLNSFNYNNAAQAVDWGSQPTAATQPTATAQQPTQRKTRYDVAQEQYEQGRQQTNATPISQTAMGSVGGYGISPTGMPVRNTQGYPQANPQPQAPAKPMAPAPRAGQWSGAPMQQTPFAPTEVEGNTQYMPLEQGEDTRQAYAGRKQAKRDLWQQQSDNVNALLAASEKRDMEAGTKRTIFTDYGSEEVVTPKRSNETRELRAAQRALRNTQRIINAADNEAGFGQGLKERVFDIDNWDFGITDITDLNALKRAMDAFDKGEKLTESQQALLDAKALEMAVNVYFASDLSKGYQAGQDIAGSLPFMAEFMLGIGSAASKATSKALVKYFTKRFAKAMENKVVNTAVRGGARVLSDLERAAVMTGTTGAVGTEADARRRMMGQVRYNEDEQGKVTYAGHTQGDDEWKARRKAATARTLTNFSEMFGEYLGFLGRGGRWLSGTKGGKFFGLDKVAGFIDNVASSEIGSFIGRIESKAQFHGAVGEMAEELFDGVTNATFVGDQTLQEVFGKENLTRTALSVGIMSMFFSGAKLGGYGVAKGFNAADMAVRTRRADRAAANAFGTQWDGVRGQLDGATAEQAADIIQGMYESGEYTDEQLQSALNYAIYKKGNEMIERYKANNQTPQEAAAEQSYNTGYEDATTDELRSDLNIAYTDARAKLVELIGEDAVNDIDSDPLAMQAQYDQDMTVDDNTKYAIASYVSAKSAWDGVQQRISDDAADRADQRRAEGERMAYKGKGDMQGAIRPLIINEDSSERDPETGERIKKTVYIVNGNIAIEPNGNGLSREGTDKTIYVYDPETGDTHELDPFGGAGVLSVGDVVSMEDYLADNEQQSQAEVQQAAETAQGKVKVNTPFETPQGRKGVVQSIEGDNAIVLFADGEMEQASMPLAEVQQYADALRRQEYEARHPQQTAAEQPQQPNTATEGQTPTAEAETPTKGEQATEDTRTPAQRTYDDIVAKLGVDRASKKIDASAKVKADRLKKAEKAMKTAQEAADNTEYGSKEEQKAEEAVIKAQAEYDAAQQDMAAWDEVRKLRDQALLAQSEAEDAARKAELERKRAAETEAQRKQREEYEAEQARRKTEAEAVERRRQEENERLKQQAVNPQPAEQPAPIEGTKGQASQLAIARQELEGDPEALAMLDETEPRTLVEVAATLLASGKNATKLLKEDFKRETGYSDADVKRYPFLFAGADKGGITLARFGEMVVEAAREYGVQFDENDATAGIGAALELLGSVSSQADINGYITNSRIAEAYDYHHAALGAKRARMLEAYGMTEGEYESYMSWLEDAIEQGKSTLSDEEFNQIFNVYGQGQTTDVARGNQKGAETAERTESAETDVSQNGERGNGETDSETGEQAAVSKYEEAESAFFGFLEWTNWEYGTNYDWNSLMSFLKWANKKAKAKNQPLRKFVREWIGDKYPPKDAAELTDKIFAALKEREEAKKATAQQPKEEAEGGTGTAPQPVGGATAQTETPQQELERYKAKWPYMPAEVEYIDKAIESEQWVIDLVKKGHEKIGIFNAEPLEFYENNLKELQRYKELVQSLTPTTTEETSEQPTEQTPAAGQDKETAEGENQLVENFPSRGSKPAITRTHTYSPIEGETGIGVYSRVDTKTKSGEEVSRKEDYYVDLPLDINSDEDKSKYREIGGYRVYLSQGKLRLMDIPTLEEARRLKALAYATIKGENTEQQETPKQEPKAEKEEAAEPKEPKRLISDEQMDELKERLRKKLRGQLNSGIDPETLSIGLQLAVGHIERGLTKFADFAKRMVEDLGDAIRPYLKSFYNGARDFPGAEKLAEQMTPYDEVRAFDVENFDKERPSSIVETAKEIAAEQEIEKQVEQIKPVVVSLVASSLPEDRDLIDRPEKKPSKGNKKEDSTLSNTEQGQLDLFGSPSDTETETPSESNLKFTEEQRAKVSEWVKGDLLRGLDSGERPFKSVADIRKMAQRAGLDVDIDGRDDVALQEMVEDGLVRAARQIIERGGYGGSKSRTAYEAICQLYDLQPTISRRSDNRVKMQQYSTPLPMAFVADMFAWKPNSRTLEPTAGNGMLVFAIPAKNVVVNELDETRLANLRQQGFEMVLNEDATSAAFTPKAYDSVIANPPFGKAEAKSYDGKSIAGLDEQIALNALSAMKDNGRAAIIIGGNMEYGSNGAIKGNKAFWTYLYDHYNVKGVVDMEGKLYAKQGTTYPTRMILIDGRRSEEERAQSTIYPPRKHEAIRKAETFEDLYDIVTEVLNSNNKTNGNEVLRTSSSPVTADTDNAAGKPNAVSNGEQPNANAGNGQNAGTRPTDSRGSGESNKPTEQRPTQTTARPSNGGTELTGNAGVSKPQGNNGGNAVRGGERGGSGRAGDTERVQHDGVRGNGNAASGVRLTEQRETEKRTLTEEKLSYRPHNSAFSLQSVAPAAMVEAMDKSLAEIENTWGNIDEFVTNELGYDSVEEMHNALAAEQVDSVAMAIFQMQQGKAMIIGDQTGVGKGRQMAALIRWACRHGKKPIFITQKDDLFTDLYRDLVDVGSGDLRPFIFNAATESKDKETGKKKYLGGVMLDADGNLVYKALGSAAQAKIFASGKLPDEYDFVVLTYSQVNTGDMISSEAGKGYAKESGNRSKKTNAEKSKKPTPKATFLRDIAQSNYLFLDESHTAAGDSNVGAFIRSIIGTYAGSQAGYAQGVNTGGVAGVTFASATFAKRPDTMPMYAMRTAMSEANVQPYELISIIARGGVTLQEIMSRALTESGQMVRRERDMSDVRTDWETIDNPELVQRARENYDKTIVAFNAIIKFQEDYVKPMIDALDAQLSLTASSADVKKGTNKMGVENVPFASKTYNYTKQLMLALKVDAIVDRVEQEIKAGRHPVIALESTMEASIKDYNAGDVIGEPTFSASLLRGLDNCMQYTVKDEDGKESHSRYDPRDLGPDGERAYYELQDFIRQSTSGVFISPLDAIIEKLHERGYKVGELTGRNSYVERDADGNVVVKKRTDKDKKRMQRDFNSGALDVLILNKSASTGISLHASEKFSDQRQRSMIIAQPLSDINDYMQMIGRIDRTGQVHRGYYINLGLPVPAESRFLMMLSTKLKSLNANTTTSQESESSNVEAPDLLNKYGSQVIVEYLRDNPDIYVKMGEPLKKSMGQKLKANELDNYEAPKNDEVARKITGYVALLNTKEQEDFYNDVVRRYTDLIKYLDSTGTNDLKITVMPLKAKTLSKSVSSEGKDPNGSNPFAQNAYVEEVEMDVLRKPMKADEIRKSIEQLNTLQGTGKGYVGTAAQGKKAGERALEIAGVVEREEAAKLAAEEERHAAALQSAEAAIAKRREKLSGQQNISEEEKAEKLAEYTAETMQKVNERHEANMNKIRSTTYFMKEGLRRYSVGITYILPQESGEDNSASMFTSPAIFCGYKVKDSKLTPSTSFAVFATLDGRRRIEVKFTDNQTNDQIGFLTSSNIAQARQITLDNWDSHVPTNTRKKGYIMTGNILQAVSDTQDEATGAYVGQLISYTDEEGNIHDGVLMPDRWQPAMLKTSGVPILARLAQLLRGGSVTSTDGKVTITTNRYGDGELSVPKTKKEGEKYFTNETILSAIIGGFWEKRGKFNADIVGEDNIRTVVTELSNMGVRVKADPSTDSDVRFRGEEEPVFYSNAMRAVENIKQERATPEQWVKMIEKQGGMKAGEDKWLGLSEWLKGSDAKTLTKGEVLDYIRANEIQVEEVEYGNSLFTPTIKASLEREIANGKEEGKTVEEVLQEWDEMASDMKPKVTMMDAYKNGIFNVDDEGRITNVPVLNSINYTRLQYITDFLDNKREIVLTVPTIEPWNEHDEVHFGEAGGGRAVAWVRFGETTDADGKRVLVIDEIQSKRHQEGREKGYKKNIETLRNEEEKARKKKDEYTDYLFEKYKDVDGYPTDFATKEEKEKLSTLRDNWLQTKQALNNNFKGIPDAPFDKNWHEVAMKRILRFAAENGYDKVAWTKGEQQAERYDIGNVVESIEKIDENTYRINTKDGSPYQELEFDDDGVYRDEDDATLNNKSMADIFGKELAEKLQKMPAGETLKEDGLRIGGEGMKGFYDQILPRFMDKYGKKWGVKTGEVELPNIGDNGLTMWSVDVTDDMRESVMRGQPLFRNLEESDNVVNNADAGTRPLTDREKIAKLESEPKVKVYRSMQLIDGKLYPPMSAMVDGQLREPSEIGVWEEAEEHPELVDENGKFKLDKGNKKSLKAAYNPYIHTSRTMLNDQFSEAQSRPNLVVVEVEIPESELNGTYKAEKAKDSVGAKQWKAGVIQGQLSGTREVILSRWAKPVRIVPDAEVAENIARQIEGQVSVMPSNVVTPQVRAELEKRGVRFVETDNTGRLTSGSRKGETWAQVYGKNATKQREGGEEANAGEWYDRNSVERIGEFAGYTPKQIAAMNARQEQSARKQFNDAAEKLHLSDNITFADTIADVPGLTDKQRREWRRKKGWYSPRTGKIVIILGNHKSMDDVMKSILHEGVAHHGLRQMFGEHFNTFLDNVYRVASPEIRGRINEMAKKHGWDFREATEEYLAMLAEDTDFERPENQSWWKQVKEWFIDLLHKIGFKLHDAYDTITDNELRYILWRSYENLVNPGRFNSVVEEAKDIAKQYELKVGQWDETWTVAAEEEPNATMEFNGRRVPIWATNGRRNGINKGGIKPSINLNEIAEIKAEAENDGFVAGIGIDMTMTDGNVYHLWVGADKEEEDYETTEFYPQGEDEDIPNEEMTERLGDFFGENVNKIFGSIIGGYIMTSGRRGFTLSHDEIMRMGGVRDNRKGSDYNVAADGVAEDGVRFRDGEDKKYAPKAQAAGLYERAMNDGWNQFTEAMQDSMMSVKKLVMSVLEARGEKGKKMRIEDVAGYENPWLAENRLRGSIKNQVFAWQRDYMEPLRKAIYDITGGIKPAYDELMDYMMAKHGLERNEVLAKRDAKKAWEEQNKSEIGNPNYTAAKNAAFANIDAGVDDLYLEQRKKDYAGLTALTGKEDVEEAEKEAQRMVDEFEKRFDTTKLWAATNAATRSSLFTMLECGMITPARHSEIRDMFKYYIPLQGFDSDVAEDVYAYMGSDGTRLYGTAIRAAKGRKSKADDPIATIAMNGEAAIRRGNRNLMKQHFLRFVQAHPSDLVSINDVWLRKNANGEWEQYFDADLKETDTPEEVADKVRDFNERMEQEAAANPDLYKRSRDLPNVPFRVLNTRDMKQHQVMVQVNGKNYLLTVNGNPRAAQALNGLSNPDVFTESVFGKAMNIAQSVTRELSQFYTTRKPSFVLSNFSRDSIYTNLIVGVKEDKKYSRAFHKNWANMNPATMGKLFSEWVNGKLRNKILAGTATDIERMFNDFLMYGGETGWISMRDIERQKKDLQKALKQEGNTAAQKWKSFWATVDLANRAVENCARFAAFMTSQQMGRSIERSVWDAKEISVNFEKKGAGDKFLGSKNQTVGGWIGAVIGGWCRGNYAFWNAGVQGISNFYRAAKKKPGKFALRIFAMNFTLGMMAPLISALLGGDDDDENNYFNLPEYKRRNNLCFRFTKHMPWITIPLPIEFRAIYGLGELAMCHMLGKEHFYNGWDCAKAYMQQLSQVLPLDFLEGGGGWHVLLPTYAKPAAEAYANEGWTGLPIYKENSYGQYDKLPEWQRAYPNTNMLLVNGTRWINEATVSGDLYTGGNNEDVKGFINWNPARIEYMLRGYFGGYYSMYEHLAKTISTIAGKREFEWRNIPLAHVLITEGDERTAERSIKNEYYKIVDDYENTDHKVSQYDEKAHTEKENEERRQKLNTDKRYLRHEIVDIYKTLIDKLNDTKKNADEEEKKAIEEYQAGLRKEMVDMVHNLESKSKSELEKGDNLGQIDELAEQALGSRYESGDLSVRKAIGSMTAKRIGERYGSEASDGYGSGSALDTEYGKIYEKHRTYTDMAGDIMLNEEIKRAKAEKDYARLDVLEDAKKDIADNRDDLNQYMTQEGIDNIMEVIRTIRRKALYPEQAANPTDNVEE